MTSYLQVKLTLEKDVACPTWDSIHLHATAYTGWHSSSWNAQSKGILKGLCPDRGRRKQPLQGLSLKGKVWVGASGGWGGSRDRARKRAEGLIYDQLFDSVSGVPGVNAAVPIS